MNLVEARIPMADGVELAATLHLPSPSLGPQPCVLEALPYRKDDLTSSYRPEYQRLCDDHAYAVARLDVRGTGSSGGRATDEYPVQEQRDLAEVIAWLAAQDWCDGNVGMYGTSYSGFNSLHMAAEHPPALKAVVAIFATDDRYTDDVHYCGGSVRWLDRVDYCHYMTPMNALPPVPALWGEGWRDEWLARIEEHEPWLFTWLEHQRRDAYWQHGSIRPGYDVDVPVLVVAGWADGYRNNSFRTLAAMRAAGRRAELLAGPWAHASTATSLPGPRIDLVPEMVAWWDRWLRADGTSAAPPARWYARSSHVPAPDLDTVPGEWRADVWPSPRSGLRVVPLAARPPYEVVPDVGLAAWISCSGHLPWGQPDDQRADDARSVTWEVPLPDGLEIAGNPLVRLRVSSSAPVALVSLRLCDVAADGTSTLVTRGTLNLTRRDGMASAAALRPGAAYDVEIELEATAWRWEPGRVLRLALAGADWPTVAAAPAPFALTVQGGELELPVYRPEGSPFPVPTFTPGAAESPEDGVGITWRTSRDVLRRTTSALVDHGGAPYVTPYGSARDHYRGEVAVASRTFAQTATADVVFDLHYDDDGAGEPVRCCVRSTLDMTADGDTYAVHVALVAEQDGETIATRHWDRSFDRDLA